MKIPLGIPSLSGEELEAVRKVLESRRFVMGEQNKAFEEEFAAFCGIKHAVAVSSGSAALELVLRAYGVGHGDKVVTVSHTFVATVSSILLCGAEPVLVDVDPKSYTIDPRELKEKLDSRVKVVIPVHIYGHPADMKAVREVAEKRGVKVVEDAAQAHCAEYRGVNVGRLGDSACFSFYPSKNMNVAGEGGMVVTDDKELAEQVKMISNHGRKGKYLHEILGSNYRLSEIHAAIGRVQLKKVSEWVERRRKIASIYNSLLSRLKDITTPSEASWARHAYHVYAVKTPDRDKLREWLAAQGVETGVHYPIPIHQQPFYTRLKQDVEGLPVTEDLSAKILSLPMYPDLKDGEISYVVNQIAAFLKQK